MKYRFKNIFKLSNHTNDIILMNFKLLVTYNNQLDYSHVIKRNHHFYGPTWVIFVQMFITIIHVLFVIFTNVIS